jgi:hypothetical protein
MNGIAHGLCRTGGMYGYTEMYMRAETMDIFNLGRVP